MTGKVLKGRFRPNLIAATVAMWLLIPAAISLAATNGRIAYQTNVHATEQIYTMNADGSDKVRVAAYVGNSDQYPGFAPNGLRIAFISDLGLGGSNEIFAMNTDGSGLLQLSGNDKVNASPEYSADSLKITFVSDMSGGGLLDQEIYTIPATGGVATRLTTNALPDADPSFSPDGQTVIYSCSTGVVGDDDLCTVNADGLSPPVKLRDSAASDGGPKYSPDGSRITFYSNQEGGGAGYDKNEIHTMPATIDALATNLTTNSVADTNPVYSPDGTRIAFDTNRNDNEYDIYTMDTAGTNLAQLTSGTAREQHPSWANAIPVTPTPVTPPTTEPSGKLSISCTSPKMKSGKTKRVSKKRLSKYMKSGFKCVISNPTNVNAIGASLVREKKVRKKSKKKSKKAFISKKKKKKTVTRCYRFDKPKKRTRCRTTKSHGLALKVASNGDIKITYKPLARKRKGKVKHSKNARRLLKRMSKGKVLRRGKYRLTFAAHVQTQSNPKKTTKKYFRFYFRVKK